jgi:hypothetical protein
LNITTYNTGSPFEATHPSSGNKRRRKQKGKTDEISEQDLVNSIGRGAGAADNQLHTRLCANFVLLGLV